MTKPSDFIMTSDYATLKNDNTGTLSVTLPNTASISAGNIATYTDTLAMGVAGGGLRARVSTTKGGGWHSYPVVLYSVTSGATVSGSPSGYDIYVNVHRTSSTEVKLTVAIPNPYASTMSISGMSQTITAHVATFLPPTP